MRDWELVYHQQRLELQHRNQAFGKPLFVDFTADAQRWRVARTRELLVKAVGIRKNYLPQVLDISAGLGKDAYLLYCCGCTVQLVERSPVIAALLQDGLQRANCTMPLYIGEASSYLAQLLTYPQQERPDVIYFDPIFPQKNKMALSRKSARILREIVGEDADAGNVFQLARQVAKKRLVIKRPLHSACIAEQKPDIIFRGKSIRFDVYIC